MPFVQQIECPHCKKVFPVPRKRHLPGGPRSWNGPTGTLCGLRDPSGKLTEACKGGEEPNCVICVRKREAKDQHDAEKCL